MLFSRLSRGGTRFEAQRNLIQKAYGIDGGAGVAADQQGRVYVFWHAPIPGNKGEDFRRVWMTRSLDDGKTFEPEQMAWDRATGACGCCSLDSYADRAGRIYVLFRSAQDVFHRDMYLLESSDHGVSFRGSDVSKWDVGYCVMSSEAFASGPHGTLGAWETDKQVHFGRIDSDAATASDSIVSSAATNQKYPALAINREGLVLVAWTEGMGWKRGGSVHWRMFDQAGHPVGRAESAGGVPAWSLVSTYAEANGSFVVLY
jgi:hypothetical protein